MSGLPTDTAIKIIRAFGYFSHLANLAEDQHHIRRTRAYAMAKRAAAARHDGLCAGRARRRRHFARTARRRSSRHALCVPVLTAHPTEVQRKSIIDREMEIARLLDERDRVQFTPEELAANRKALRRAVLTLWQTSLLRGTRLRVLDEIENALAYYDHTFLRRAARASTPTSRTSSGLRRGGLACRPSCAWAAGSAATATAIPSSPPR